MNVSCLPLMFKVQCLTDTLQLIMETQPSMLLCLGDHHFILQVSVLNESAIQNAISNLYSIVETVPLTILEHHALRDEFWKQKIAPISELPLRRVHGLLTAAEYAGEDNIFLESRRKQLFKEFPPSKEFQQWMKTLNNKQIAKPPI